MQLARKLYGLDTRSVPGKLRQVALALWLESRYSKHDILEAYANVAPFGGNVQGVGAASLIHFDKPAAALTFAEALTLAVIPQAPQARGATAGESSALRAARLQLLDTWARYHAVPPEARAAAGKPILLRSPSGLPFEAPHLADALLSQRAAGAQVVTSLDLPLQQLPESVLGKYVEGVRDLGVRN